jgi:regulator of nonsense transcripts 1
LKSFAIQFKKDMSSQAAISSALSFIDDDDDQMPPVRPSGSHQPAVGVNPVSVVDYGKSSNVGFINNAFSDISLVDVEETPGNPDLNSTGTMYGYREYDEAMIDGEGEYGSDVEDEERVQELPEHACQYCGIHSAGCVIQCAHADCKRWFCNGKSGTKLTSHIITHMVRNKHKEVVLHKDSPLGEMPLECYQCGTRNIFMLGFISAKTDNVVVILCRDPCAQQTTQQMLSGARGGSNNDSGLDGIGKSSETPSGSLGGGHDSNANVQPSGMGDDWDLSQWQPLIEERALLNWLVKFPGETEISRSRLVSMSMINRLEETWKKDPLAKMNSDSAKGSLSNDEEMAAEQKAKEMPHPVLPSYDDAFQYQDIFGPLVRMEADNDKSMKESQTQEGIIVRWDVGLSSKPVAWFSFPRSDTELRLVPGDELRLLRPSDSASRKDWDCEGHVIKVIGDEIGLELDTVVSSTPNTNITTSNNTLSTTSLTSISMMNNKSNNKSNKHFHQHHGIHHHHHHQQHQHQVPLELTHGFRVEFVWKSTSFDRMLNAMTTLKSQESAVSNYLYHKLMGHDVEEEWLRPYDLTSRKVEETKIPNLPELNPSQMEAVKAVIASPLSLIQGPPGTGKTVTSASIVYHLSQLGNGPILVCAPSNVAVDHLTERIDRTGLRVVRIAAKSREAVPSSVDHLTLHDQVRQLLKDMLSTSTTSTSTITHSSTSSGDTSQLSSRGGNISNFVNPNSKDKDIGGGGGGGQGPNSKTHPGGYKLTLAKLQKLRDDHGELSPSDEKKYQSLKRALELEILKTAQVICTTCVGAGDSRLNRFNFKAVLIDESTQSTEPECLIPIVRGAQQVILVGDHCQLGPVIMCRQAGIAGLSQSLFERLIRLGVKPIRLNIQYRMHPCLSEWPSNIFYEGSLQNGVTTKQRSAPPGVKFPWPDPSCPMFFYASMGQEEISASATSYLNRQEAALCEKVLNALMRGGVKPTSIGVITPYEGQRAHLVSNLKRNLSQEVAEAIEVASVDSFQGREKDYIIFSCVRSNESGGNGNGIDSPSFSHYNKTTANIGFLADPRRLNVALTRAKYGLILLGNPRLLSKQPLWHNLLIHFADQECLVEGQLTALKQTSYKLPSQRLGYTYAPEDKLSAYTWQYQQMKEEEEFRRLQQQDAQWMGSADSDVGFGGGGGGNYPFGGVGGSAGHHGHQANLSQASSIGGGSGINPYSYASSASSAYQAGGYHPSAYAPGNASLNTRSARASLASLGSSHHGGGSTYASNSSTDGGKSAPSSSGGHAKNAKNSSKPKQGQNRGGGRQQQGGQQQHQGKARQGGGGRPNNKQSHQQRESEILTQTSTAASQSSSHVGGRGHNNQYSPYLAGLSTQQSQEGASSSSQDFGVGSSSSQSMSQHIGTQPF